LGKFTSVQLCSFAKGNCLETGGEEFGGGGVVVVSRMSNKPSDQM